MAVSKCLLCSKENDRKLMYKNVTLSTVTDKKTGKEKGKKKTEYFCNKECFEEYKKVINERRCHREIINIICLDILACPFNTLMVSELNENIYKYYKKEVVLQYLQENKEQIYNSIKHKDFNNIMIKIRYMIAIIQNNLVKFKYKDYEKEVEYNYYDPVEIIQHNPKKNKRKGLKELEMKYIREVKHDCLK